MADDTTAGVGFRNPARAIGRLFEGPEREVSGDQVRFYEQNGYVAPVRILQERQLERMREALERMIWEAEHPRRRELIGLPKLERGRAVPMIYFQGAWLAEEAFHDVIFAPAIVRPLAQLLGVPGVRFWHDQIFYKPPKHGGVVAWHQDYSYWTRTEPIGHITCFLALDDTTLGNGCLHVIPGSHRWPLLPTVPLTGTAADMDAIKTILTPEQLGQFKPTPIFLKAGECSFHHPLALHGSYANTTDGPRRGVVLNFMKSDTRSAGSDKPPMPGAPIFPRGAIIEGELFPTVTGE